MAPQITRVGDLTVAVERPATSSGKPPVLLIHGMFGGAWQWEYYQAQLARRGYASHAINLRGHHGSRPVRNIGKVSLDQFVVDALEVARTLKNPIVIGHSMGGLITQKVAEVGACRAAVLVAAAPPRWIPVVSWLLLKKQLKYTKALLLHEPIVPDRSDADVLMFNRTPVADREKMYPRLVPESGKAGFELSFGVVAVHDSRVTAPMLVITGLDDQFVVPRVARALARKYGAPIREYESFAHHIMTEPGWEGPFGDIVEWMDRQ
ncbi:MAG: alpha/beta fold hydrolase [Gemmatimonadaceae bacterium]